MLQSFIIVLREGFESFLLVAVIFSYLKKSGRPQLSPAVYSAIGVGLGHQRDARLPALPNANGRP